MSLNIVQYSHIKEIVSSASCCFVGTFIFFTFLIHNVTDSLCGLVVRDTGYQIFLKVVGLERCPLSLESTTVEELLGRKDSGSSLKIPEYVRWDSSL
jgi:hypothetical protein